MRRIATLVLTLVLLSGCDLLGSEDDNTYTFNVAEQTVLTSKHSYLSSRDSTFWDFTFVTFAPLDVDANPQVFARRGGKEVKLPGKLGINETDTVDIFALQTGEPSDTLEITGMIYGFNAGQDTTMRTDVDVTLLVR